MSPTPRTRALGYIRVSSYLGRDRGDALTEDVQLEKIQQWCAVADLDLVDVLGDIDRSGKDFDARGRPAFDELRTRLRPARPRRSSRTGCRASTATSTRRSARCGGCATRASSSIRRPSASTSRARTAG